MMMMMAVMTSFLVDVRMGGWKIEAKALHPVTCCPKPLSLLTHWRGGDSMYLLMNGSFSLPALQLLQWPLLLLLLLLIFALVGAPTE